jgi:glycosyltransferase involved in cell wall biosynthesis
MKSIKIIYIIDTLEHVGGTEKHLYQILKGLKSRHFDMQVVTFKYLQNDLTKEIQNLNIPIHCIAYKRALSITGIYKVWRLVRMIRAINPDFVETFHHSSDTFGVLCAKLAGVKRIISNKRDLALYKTTFQQLISKWTNHFVDDFVAVCHRVGDHMKNMEKIAKNKIFVLYNGVEIGNNKLPSHGMNTKLRSRYAIGQNCLVITVVANFRKEKGHSVLFDAIKILKAKSVELKVFLVGKGPLSESLQFECKQNQLDDVVVFTGYVANTKDYIQFADICCLPAIANEGFSNAILEQMESGKPVVATDVGGNAEAIVDGQSGFIVPPGDADALADKFLYFAQNKNQISRFGENARARVEKYFDLGQMIAKKEKYYFERLDW